MNNGGNGSTNCSDILMCTHILWSRLPKMMLAAIDEQKEKKKENRKKLAQSDANLFDVGHLEKTAVKATIHKKCKDEQTLSFFTLSTMIKATHQNLCAFEGRKRAKQVKRIVERKKEETFCSISRDTMPSNGFF